MYFKPSKLGSQGLDDATLRADKEGCKHIGPCGVGQKALYLNTYFLDRRLYVPVSNIQRAFKRVAMSKGGFTGKGIFGSMSFLVVEYDKGEHVQCQFRHESDVDLFIAEIQARFPQIKTISEAAAKLMAEEEAREKAKYKKHLSDTAKASIATLQSARAYLEKRPELCTLLESRSRAKRQGENAHPFYRWAAFAILLMSAIAATYGMYCWWTGAGEYGIYITLIGLAFVFLFAGLNVIPLQRKNKHLLKAELDETRAEVEEYLAGFKGEFPVPVRYAHPIVIGRMIRSIRYGRSETVQESYEDMKEVLRSLNSSVRVSRTEYEEVVAVKPMFLLECYK